MFGLDVLDVYRRFEQRNRFKQCVFHCGDAKLHVVSVRICRIVKLLNCRSESNFRRIERFDDPLVDWNKLILGWHAILKQTHITTMVLRMHRSIWIWSRICEKKEIVPAILPRICDVRILSPFAFHITHRLLQFNKLITFSLMPFDTNRTEHDKNICIASSPSPSSSLFSEKLLLFAVHFSVLSYVHSLHLCTHCYSISAYYCNYG